MRNGGGRERERERETGGKEKEKETEKQGGRERKREKREREIFCCYSTTSYPCQIIVSLAIFSFIFLRERNSGLIGAAMTRGRGGGRG